jgi:aldehyde:ferredoxin oxidoreductase
MANDVDKRVVLFVDLTTGSSHTEQIDASGTLGLGGKVLGTRLLEKYLDPQVDPVAPGNIVALLPSRLNSFGMSGTGRFGAFTKSPLTGIWLESYLGGSFARVLTETGWDAVVITGKAKQAVRLHVDSAGAQVLPAAELWGKDTFATEDEILSLLDRRSAVLSIGVAGENLVRVASVMHERAHTLGRGGLGAVFGSKMLKAVSVTSPGSAKREAQEQFVQTRREISQLAVDSPTATTYHKFGTPVMVALLNEAGTFPTDFFLKGTAPHRATLEVERWLDWSTKESDTCSPCPLRCRHRYTLTQGPEAGREYHQPEYETIYTFGGSCMVEDVRGVMKLNEICNRLGLDTISAGNLVAIAIKGKQLGLIVDGPDPGDVAGIAESLEAIASRSTRTAEILAQGMDDALAEFGMSEWSITSKRLDPAGYEPRRLKGMALSYAVSVRGACHLRATFYKAELGGILEGMDDETFVRTYIDWEDRMLLLDSLTMCRFYRDLMTWDRITSAASQLNGAPVTKEQLETLSAETSTRIRRLNFAFGLTPADDTVAERFFRQPTDRAAALDRAELENRVRIYWKLRGWGETGLAGCVAAAE